MFNEEAESSGEGKEPVPSAEPFQSQRENKKIESAGGGAEPRECGERERNTFLRAFYNRRVFCRNEVDDCVLMRRVSLTDQEMLRSRALS